LARAVRLANRRQRLRAQMDGLSAKQREWHTLPPDCSSDSSDSHSSVGLQRCANGPTWAIVGGVLATALAAAVVSARTRGSIYSGEVRRTVNSASGVSIWELVSAHSSVPSLPRFAVAYVWSDAEKFYGQRNWDIDQRSFVGPYSQGRGACGLALSAIASKRFLQEAAGPHAIADAVVLTDLIDDEHAAHLKGFGIRVLFTNLTALYTFDKYDFNTPYHEDHRASYFKLRASSLKAGLAGLLEYQSIIYLDTDAYLVARPLDPDPFSGLDNRSEFLTFPCCADAPLAVGWFALRPQQDAFEDMVKLLDAGFSPETG